MPVPSQETIEPILETYREPIVETVRAAWSDWRVSPYAGTWRCKRSRANFVWEQIIQHAHIKFAGFGGLRIIEGQETFRFLVGDQVLFRFKKGDETGLTRNVPTQLALAFHDHEADLFNLPSVHRVEVAYTLNRLETEIEDVIVVARDSDTVVWTYSLLEESGNVEPFPTLPNLVDPSEKPARRLVRPRNIHDAEKRDKSD